MMKNYSHYSYSRLFWATFFCLVISTYTSAQSRFQNTFRTGVGFAYIVEGDNSGALFSNQYSRAFSNRVNGAVTLEYLSSSRYGETTKLFTSRKAFIMIDASLMADVLQKPVTALRIGVGPAIRRRSELDLIAGAAGANTSPGISGNEAFVHNRTRDIGGKFTLENEFYYDNRLSFGWRVAGYVYDAGTSIFSVGLHLGVSF